VSPITLDSLTSGFNIATDLTLEKGFNEMMGFTGPEVRDLILSTARFDVTQSDIDNLMDTLIGNYNGYLFNRRAETRLYSSNMILHYLQAYAEDKSPPDELLDGNAATDYSKIGKLFALTNKSSHAAVLESILDGDELPVNLTAIFSLERDFTVDDLKSLLFYMGFLTIGREEAGTIYLRVPNYVITGLYFEYFRKVLEDETNLKLDVGAMQEAINDIAKNGANEKFVKFIEDILSSMANRNYRNMTEKSIQHIMYACLITRASMKSLAVSST